MQLFLDQAKLGYLFWSYFPEERVEAPQSQAIGKETDKDKSGKKKKKDKKKDNEKDKNNIGKEKDKEDSS
eukprot:3622643-Amphidinium_carterae.1